MNRRPTLPLIVTIVLVLPLLIGLLSPLSSAAQTPGAYIVLGDSIAAGIGSSLPRSRGNAAIVTGWLEQLSGSDVPLDNLAVPGETATSFIDGGQLQRFRDSVARTKASGVPIAAVSVSLGGNELLGLDSTGLSNRQSGLDVFRARYGEALGAIRDEIGPDTPLVVTTVYDLTGGDPTIQYSDSWWIEQFNSVIRQAAESEQALVADVAGQFSGRISELTHYPFDVHPSNAGHRVIAQTIWTELAFDTTPPAVTTPASVTVTRPTPTIHFSVADNVAVASVRVTGDDGSFAGPFQTADNEYVILLDFGSSNVEKVALTLEISDDGGNLTRQVITVQRAAGT
ncbi:MAG TPA: SGNH/GDSL hydrolase family protein [Thermomicrobiales bacterium]|nr:SGNH/GDSL hydrolase family protein [Thermomicrobiales bacterium]